MTQKEHQINKIQNFLDWAINKEKYHFSVTTLIKAYAKFKHNKYAKYRYILDSDTAVHSRLLTALINTGYARIFANKKAYFMKGKFINKETNKIAEIVYEECRRLNNKYDKGRLNKKYDKNKKDKVSKKEMKNNQVQLQVGNYVVYKNAQTSAVYYITYINKDNTCTLKMIFADDPKCIGTYYHKVYIEALKLFKGTRTLKVSIDAVVHIKQKIFISQ